MIISRTPFRISLFGGGSDYPKWFQNHGGSVLGFAINKYCYISLRPLPPFFEHRHRLVYSRIENVSSIEEIQHPAVRAVLMDRKVEYGVEIHHDGDLPARSGLGSSSSFTVGLLNAVQAQSGRISSRRFLASEAIRIEQQVIGENVGSQDQVWAAYGGINRIDFQRDGTFAVEPLIIPSERQKLLLSHCLLFFTGLSRFASEIAGKQIANMDQRESHLHKMVYLVSEAEQVIGSPWADITDIGELMHESWMLKRELADAVSPPEVDAIYEAGREAGAIGGKLLGAGGGGFFLFFVPPEKRQAVRQRLSNLLEVGFDFDHSGSRIIVYEPEA